MRFALIVCLIGATAACRGSSAAPTPVSVDTTTNIAGNWNGTISSSNNATMQIGMALTQSGADVSGTWNSTSVRWEGQFSGAVRGSSVDGQFMFTGMAADGTLCRGAATVTGTATASTMTLTSASGVVGPACPAPLPIGLTIDVRRQS